MAIKATIIKLDLTISDMDRNYYQQHNLTMAQHPSETEQRLILPYTKKLIRSTDIEREHFSITRKLFEHPVLFPKNRGNTCWS